MNPYQMPVEPPQDVRNWPEFQRELAALINKYSLERPSNLPDFVLAEYLVQCLVALNIATLTTRPADEFNVVKLGR